MSRKPRPTRVARHRLGARHGIAIRLGLAAVAIVVAACGSSTSTGTPTPTATGTPTPTSAGTPSASGSATRPWMDGSKTVDQRVAALLAQMTLDEKIGQMTQIEVGGVDPAGTASALLGSVLSGGDGNPKGENTAQNWYSMVKGYQDAATGTRLGIPILYGADMVHGASHMTGTVVFPHNVGMGATHDASLVKQVCQVTAAETSRRACAGPSGRPSPCPRTSAGAGPTRATARTRTSSASSGPRAWKACREPA